MLKNINIFKILQETPGNIEKEEKIKKFSFNFVLVNLHKKAKKSSSS